jgi:hypothetical protein
VGRILGQQVVEKPSALGDDVIPATAGIQEVVDLYYSRFSGLPPTRERREFFNSLLTSHPRHWPLRQWSGGRYITTSNAVAIAPSQNVDHRRVRPKLEEPAVVAEQLLPEGH